MLAPRTSCAARHRKTRLNRTLRLEPLEQRHLLAVSSQFENGVLTVSTNADDEIVVSSRNGLAKINDADPSIRQIAANDVKVVRLEGGSEARTIDVSGFSRSAFPSLEHLIFNNGPWVEPTETLAVLDETLGPGWDEKLAIKDPRGYLISGDWKTSLADGSLAKRLATAGWGNAQALLDRVVHEADQRAVIRSVRFASADDLDFDILFNGNLHDSASKPTSDEPGPVTMSLGGGGEGGDDDPPENELTIFVSNATDYEPATGTSWFTFTVYSSHGSGFSFDWRTYDSSAISVGANPDYTSVPLTHVSVSGASTTICVPILGDELYEFTESFQVSLSNISGSQAGTVVNGYGTILNSLEDVPPSIFISSPNPVGEPMAAGDWAALVFTVNLSHASGVPVAFDWNTVDVTANQFDYDQVPVAEHVIIGPGSIYAQLVLTVRGDDLYEPQETFNVELSNLNYAAAGLMTAHGTIVNIDRAIVDQTEYVVENSAGGAPVGTLDLESAFAPELGVPVYSITGGTGADFFEVDSLTGNIRVADGAVLDHESTPTYTLQLRAQALNDSATYDTAIVTIHVTDGPDPPIITPISPQTIEEGNLLALDFVAVSGSGSPDNPTFSLDGSQPIGASITPAGHFTWTPTVPGEYTINALATDTITQLVSSQMLSITITATNLAPILRSIPDQLGTPNVPIEFQARGTDENVGQHLSFSLDSGSVGSITSQGAFSWTPAANGTYSIIVRVTDDGAPAMSTFQNVSIAVTTPTVPNEAPEFAPITDESVAPGRQLSFVLLASDPNNVGLEATPQQQQRLTFRLNEGPKNATVTSNGAFSWLVPQDQATGDYAVSVIVADDGVPSLSAQQTFTVHVSDPLGSTILDAPALTAGSDTGSSQNDGITNAASPVFTGAAPNGGTVHLFVDGEDRATQPINNGTYSMTLGTPLADGVYLIQVRYATATTMSAASASLRLVIATSTASLLAPALLPDGIVSDANGAVLTNRPTFLGTAPNGATVDVLEANVVKGSATVEGGVYKITVGPLAEGAHAFSARVTDLAGNISPLSTTTSFVIDTTPPLAVSNFALSTGSDTGNPGDRITKDSTPTFTASVAAGSKGQLIVDGTEVGGLVNGSGVLAITSPQLDDGPHTVIAQVINARAARSSIRMQCKSSSTLGPAVRPCLLRTRSASPTTSCLPARPNQVAR